MQLSKIIIKFSKLWLEINLGLPYFDADYVRRYIERPETEASELQEYKSTVEMGRPISRLLIVSSLSFACCLLVGPLVQMSELNYKEPTRNLVSQSNSINHHHHQLYSFSCLLTNCTTNHLNNQQVESLIASNLLELPLISLCHPKLSYYQEITQLFGSPGFLLAFTLSVPVLISGVSLPLLQAACKSSCWLLMFLVAPQVTRRVVYDRAVELYEDLKISYVNFERNIKLKAMLDSRYRQFVGNNVCARLTCTNAVLSDRQDQSKTRAHLTLIDEEESFLQLTGIDDNQEHRRRHKFATDCLPIVRSRWWHSTASQAYLFHIMMTISNILLIQLIIYYVTFYIFHKDIQLKIKTIAHLVDSNNCTIWIKKYEDDQRIVHGSNYRKLELADYEVPTRSIGVLLFVAQLLWPFIGADLFLVTYLLVAAELFAWLYEIKLKLRLANEYLRQFDRQIEKRSENCCTICVVQSSYNEEAHKHRSLMDEFYQLFQALTSLVFFVYLKHRKFARALHSSTPTRRWQATNSQLGSVIAMEAYVAQSLKRHSLRFMEIIELLERLEVSLRLFVEQVNNYGPTMSVFLANINIYTYTYAITMIVYIRSIDGHNSSSLVILVICCVFMNCLLWLISSFHAQAKELQPLIWSLLAALSRCESRNVRLRHMQNLWLKQVIALNRDGGLALKAFNFSITYIRIIQLFIGSATLITLALR